MYIPKSQWIPHQVRNDKYDVKEALHLNKNKYFTTSDAIWKITEQNLSIQAYRNSVYLFKKFLMS